MRVDDGTLAVTSGALADADLVIESGPGIKELMAGEVTPAEADRSAGTVHLRGDQRLLARFVDLFHIDPAPVSGH